MRILQNTAWLLLAYEIGDIFDVMDSLFEQFTFLWLLRQSRYSNYKDRVINQDTSFKKGVEKIINDKSKDLKEKIKKVDGIQRAVRNDSSFSIVNNLKDNVEKAMQQSYESALKKKRKIADGLDYYIPKEQQEKIIDDIYSKTLGGQKLDPQDRVDIERDVRTTLATESSKRTLENAKDDGAIFFCCNHLQDCADDHASLSENGIPYQDELYISKDYKSKSVYKLHQQEIDEIIAKRKPIYIEDAIDGTIKYKYNLKDGTPRERGLLMCCRWNCRHIMMPITTKQANNIDEFRKSMGKQMWNGDYDKAKYKALQDIRRCERNIRQCKTEIAMLENALNYASNQNPIKSKIRELKAEIKANKEHIQSLSTKYNIPYGAKEMKRQDIENLSVDIGAFK